MPGRYDSRAYADVPELDYAVIQNPDDLTIFVLNRSREETELNIDVSGYELVSVIEHEEICAPLNMKNTKEQPDQVAPVKCSRTAVEGKQAHSRIRPYSWNMIRFVYKNL